MPGENHIEMHASSQPGEMEAIIATRGRFRVAAGVTFAPSLHPSPRSCRRVRPRRTGMHSRRSTNSVRAPQPQTRRVRAAQEICRTG